MFPICIVTGTFVDPTGAPIPGAVANTEVSGYVSSGTAIVTSSVFLSGTLVSHYNMQFESDVSGTFTLQLPQNSVIDIYIYQANYHKRVIIPTSSSADLFSLQVVEDLW